MEEKQKLDRYEMHKYWGKKPANGLLPLINKYSSEGDVLLDPFAGYGVFCAEAYLSGRNVIVNDLNPISNFITEQLLRDDVDLSLLDTYWKQIKKEFKPYIDHWFGIYIDDQKVIPSSILRDKFNRPMKVKYKISKGAIEVALSEDEINKYILFEESQAILDWYPRDKLIINSRISAKPNMNIADLFTKRTLACHARLFSLINQHAKGSEKQILLLAFTANLANCSKLVPPINSRGQMSQGAWMTGFYIGETYIENNVLQYFENRLKKVVNGKKDFIKSNSNTLFTNHEKKNNIKYYINSNDAKHLIDIKNDSIDYVFTDPPYGDAVPYFEQSIIWNSWLQLSPDYDNEIVISDSKIRDKNVKKYETDIFKAIGEIKRVLKMNKYFSLTYHSISGLEWKAITNACIKNNFKLFDYEWLTQKSFTPRQIARTKTIKGDVLVTLQKVEEELPLQFLSDTELSKLVLSYIDSIIGTNGKDTNHILMEVMKWVFEHRIIIENIDVCNILKDKFTLNDNELWIR